MRRPNPPTKPKKAEPKELKGWVGESESFFCHKAKSRWAVVFCEKEQWHWKAWEPCWDGRSIRGIRLNPDDAKVDALRIRFPTKKR